VKKAVPVERPKALKGSENSSVWLENSFPSWESLELIPYWAIATNVITRKKLKAFWEQYRHAEIPLGTWYQIVSKGSWSFPADVKVPFGNNVDFVGDNRAIFDIGGDRYRLVVHFAYEYKTALIKFVGTHEEYDITNAKAA
jgi:mRNA interferase HigB